MASSAVPGWRLAAVAADEVQRLFGQHLGQVAAVAGAVALVDAQLVAVVVGPAAAEADELLEAARVRLEARRRIDFLTYLGVELFEFAAAYACA